MTSNNDLLKIGDFARTADTNLRTLRYYEELGLLAPAKRSQGGFRYYRRTDVNRVRMIRDLQELGLHLDRIRDLIAGRRDGENHDRFAGRVRGIHPAEVGPFPGRNAGFLRIGVANAPGRCIDKGLPRARSLRTRVDTPVVRVHGGPTP